MWTSHSLPFRSPLSIITLTAVRNRDNEVYLITVSCYKGMMKELEASGMTIRGVVEGTMRGVIKRTMGVGCLYFHQHL
jgi:hypothetical protein